jgi:hypothetical protein
VKKLDPRLRHVLQSTAASPGEAVTVAELSGRVGLAGTVAAPETVEVLVRCTDEAALGELAALGVDVRAPVPGVSVVAAVQVPVVDLERLESLDGVQRIESSRQLFPELDRSLEAVQAAVVHSAELPVDGDLRLDVPTLGDSTAVRVDMRLRADVHFSIAGLPADTAGRPCTVHLLAHELAAGGARILGGQRHRLRAGQHEHTTTLRFAAPEPGSYRLLATILLPEEGAVAIAMGPAIEVKASGSAPAKRPRQRAAPVTTTEGEDA